MPNIIDARHGTVEKSTLFVSTCSKNIKGPPFKPCFSRFDSVPTAEVKPTLDELFKDGQKHENDKLGHIVTIQIRP